LPQDHLFLQRAGDDQLHIVVGRSLDDRVRRAAGLVVNRGVRRQAHLGECLGKTALGLLVLFADVDEVQVRLEAIPHAFRLGEHHLESRRECARHCDASICELVCHERSTLLLGRLSGKSPAAASLAVSRLNVEPIRLALRAGR
jgi:hypothetical protein